MDDKGYWHDREQQTSEAMRELSAQMDKSPHPQNQDRFVISIEIGSTVEVARGGDKMLAVFESADKNKVTLRPLDEAGKTRPYLELAERVMLSDGSKQAVPAQVWDNRHGKIILRTLPVGQ